MDEAQKTLAEFAAEHAAKYRGRIAYTPEDDEQDIQFLLERCHKGTIDRQTLLAWLEDSHSRRRDLWEKFPRLDDETRRSSEPRYPSLIQYNRSIRIYEETLRRLSLNDRSERLSNQVFQDSAAGTTPIGRPIPKHKPRVTAFINKILLETDRTINNKDIYRVAGYHDRTEFQKWQSGRPSSPGVTRRFDEVLEMAPSAFINKLNSLSERQ